ncbi:MAG: discoidin domain-containing protein [Tepidisphaerales bacterium]
MRNRGLVVLALLAGIPLVSDACHTVAAATIQSGVVWKDMAGEAIQAHGVGMLRVGEVYYWFGEQRERQGHCQAIRCYSSTDLKNWTLKNVVFSAQSDPSLAGISLERPKVIYNEAKCKYVLWVHKENGRDYSDARALVAVCDTPDGRYTYVKDFRPFGNESRDCTLFKDDDGSAYFISAARNNADLMCYKLTADYLDAEMQWVMCRNISREAPALFKRDGIYYLITSGCTNFGPNTNQYATSRSISGPYGPLSILCARDTWNTYVSQSAFVLPVQGTQQTTYVFMADRWKGWNLSDSRYIFLPIQFRDDGRLAPVLWADAWEIDAKTGQCTPPAAPTRAANNIARGKPCTASVKNEKDGNEASGAFDGNPRSRWCADDGDYPHWLRVDLGSSMGVSRSEIMWEQSRGSVYKYIIESSDDDEHWTVAADRSKNTDGNQTQTDSIAARGRYFRLRVLGCRPPDGGYAWASVFEWRLFNGTTNVALNRPATADSEQAGTYAAKANDGDFNTTWFTGTPKLGNWWQVDLGTVHDLTGCRLMWQDPGFYYQYKVEVSADNVNWMRVVDQTANTDVVRMPVHAFTAKGARYLRVTVTGMDEGCWLGIREVEVFDTLPLPTGHPVAQGPFQRTRSGGTIPTRVR